MITLYLHIRPGLWTIDVPFQASKIKYLYLFLLYTTFSSPRGVENVLKAFFNVEQEKTRVQSCTDELNKRATLSRPAAKLREEGKAGYHGELATKSESLSVLSFTLKKSCQLEFGSQH